MKSSEILNGQAVIKVIGVGGAGGNAINRMVLGKMKSVHLIAMNTDAQALEQNKANKKIQIGIQSTKGLGAGGDPSKGATAAKESEKAINEILEGSDMLFITAGMGGGTGTGAAPAIAEMARKKGILTVGIVSKPFLFEGPRRRQIAEEGTRKLKEHVDTLIVVPNNRLLSLVDKRTTMQQAFITADEVLKQGVQGITDIIMMPGMINVDFADVRSVMKDAGVALMGLGKGVGHDRARFAAETAANSPLLETSIQGAKKLLVNITAGADFSLNETHEAMDYLLKFAHTEDLEVFMGHVYKEDIEGVHICLLATGMDPKTAESSALPGKAVINQKEQKEQAEEKKEEQMQNIFDIPDFLKNYISDKS